MHGVTLDIHAQDGLGLRAGVGWIVGQLDSAGFTSTAGLHLGLDHNWRADARSNRFCLIGNGAHLTGRGWHFVPNEQLLGLVLVQVHCSPRYSATHERAVMRVVSHW